MCSRTHIYSKHNHGTRTRLATLHVNLCARMRAQCSQRIRLHKLPQNQFEPMFQKYDDSKRRISDNRLRDGNRNCHSPLRDTKSVSKCRMSIPVTIVVIRAVLRPSCTHHHGIVIGQRRMICAIALFSCLRASLQDSG